MVATKQPFVLYKQNANFLLIFYILVNVLKSGKILLESDRQPLKRQGLNVSMLIIFILQVLPLETDRVI